ncbi:MAG: cell division protein FtsL [Candidatus Portiera sp.]|nr:cell division protein FtsL [Portiera sp.]
MYSVLSCVKSYWKLLFFTLFIVTSVGRIGLISDNRNNVRELFTLQEEEARLLKESTSLSLESNVLTRHSRLRKYARGTLDMNKPKKVRKLVANDAN